MISNSVILDLFSGLISDLGYSITYNDIEADKTDTIGLYIRDTGGNIKTLDVDNVGISVIDLTLRVHGNTIAGSIQKCENDLVTILNRLVFYNKEYDGFKILGSSLRGRGKMLGKTSKNIPVFNISFLIQFE